MSLRCPECRLFAPDGTRRCDCGSFFRDPAADAELDGQAPDCYRASRRMLLVIATLGVLYLVAFAFTLTHESSGAPSGWFRVIGYVSVAPIIAAVTIGPAMAIGWVVWRSVFGSGRVTGLGGVVLFVVGSLSSCGIYGFHGYPMPGAVMIYMGYPGLWTILWMAATGLLVVGLCVWLSRRRHLTRKQMGEFQQLVDARGASLRAMSIEDLRESGERPAETMVFQGRPADVSVIVEPIEDGSLRVVVQGSVSGRMVTGCTHVRLDGFYKRPNGAVEPEPIGFWRQ